ncbi:hypothetical protein ACFE04_007701 [Oxalis oulophora]
MIRIVDSSSTKAYRTSYLPIYRDDPHHHHHHRKLGGGGQTRLTIEKWVHAMPVFILLCFFILWWFSYPVELEIDNGRIAAVHRLEHMIHPQSLRQTHVELAAAWTTTDDVKESAPIPSANEIPSDISTHTVSPNDVPLNNSTYTVSSPPSIR